MKRNNRMAKASKRSVTASKGPSSHYDLRSNLSTIGLWALGILNAVLIFSFVSKHFLTGDEHEISSPAEVDEMPAQAIKIEVLNGCGVQGLARIWADHLRAAGFDPVTVTNYEGGNVPRTMIFDRQSNARKNGLDAAKALGLPEDYVAYQASDQRLVAVSVIIGQDYDRFEISKK